VREMFCKTRQDTFKRLMMVRRRRGKNVEDTDRIRIRRSSEKR
jgi:hypothetical protein